MSHCTPIPDPRALPPPLFLLISTENYGLAMLGVAVATIPHCLYYAALAGRLASRFPAHLRYTGVSLRYQLCGTLLGGTTPNIGQFLLNRTVRSPPSSRTRFSRPC
ncbi:MULTISPECIES: hypothetical protein [unclassified Streptomyces]|uniref:hypothetical protein n=1 Tax=Streptomyces sp. NPDC127532 TaxID=3345399 RepID=UPI00362A4C3A